MARNEELINRIKGYLDNGFIVYQHCYFHREDLEKIIKALEQEPCEDCISRQGVINAIANTCFFLSSNDWKELMACINSLPNIKQEPKTVIYSGDGYADGYMVYDIAECPNCGYEYEDGDNFCPHCGQSLR